MQKAQAPYPALHMVSPQTKDNVSIAQESMCVVCMHSRVHSKALEGQKDLGETWGTSTSQPAKLKSRDKCHWLLEGRREVLVGRRNKNRCRRQRKRGNKGTIPELICCSSWGPGTLLGEKEVSDWGERRARHLAASKIVSPLPGGAPSNPEHIFLLCFSSSFPPSF